MRALIDLVNIVRASISILFAASVSLVLSGCVEREYDSVADDDARALSLEPIGDIRPLDPAIWRRKAVCYSGFREGQSPETGVYPGRDEILEDLRILVDAGFGLIRVFSSGVHGRRVVELIDRFQLDLKVQMGAYVSGADAENHADNMRELNNAIELANRYPDIVVSVSVGNEVLVSWSFVPVPPADMVAYIRHVRKHVAQAVTVNDNWEPFAAGKGSPISAVWGQIDFASVHTYAFWDAGFNLWDFRQTEVAPANRASAMMSAAAAYARENFDAVRAALDDAGYRIPIVIGETGWQSRPSAVLQEAIVPDFALYQAHPVNQAWYFDAMMAWAYGADFDDPGDGFSRPAGVFYFSAFDEPWKNADDNWGLWNVEREEKFVLSRIGFQDSNAVFCF